MSHKWEVFVFSPDTFKYELMYGGSSLIRAVKTAIYHKFKGSVHIRLDRCW